MGPTGLEKLVLQLSSGFINAVSQDIETGIFYALESLAEILPADRVYALFFASDGQSIENRYSFPIDDDALVGLNAMAELPWQIDLIETNITYYNGQSKTEKIDQAYIQDNQIDEGVLIKMMYGRQTVGILVIERLAAQEKPLPEYEQHLLAISRIISNGLMHNRLNNELKQAVTRAENASNVKSQFLATMSHEIRTPLHVILATAELLQDDNLNAEAQKKVSMLQSASESLLALVNDILDLSKIEQGHLEIELLPVDVFDLISRLVQVFEPVAQAKGIKIILHMSARLPSALKTDPTRLKQIVSNLLNNAIKFTSKGTVEVAIDFKYETQALGHLRIKVKDTGIGIPQDQQENIFSSFSQVDSSTTRQYGGTGLGLAICKELSQLLGGHISVKSAKGQGAEFTLEIPVEPLEKEQRLVITKPGNKKLQSIKPCRILLAEDSIDNIKIIEYLLKGVNNELVTVQNGREAIEQFKAQHFDLILMDIQMPEVNGLDATRAIRELEKERQGANIPIIAITANSFIDDIEKSLAAGCNSHLSKPLGKAEFLAEINKYIS